MFVSEYVIHMYAPRAGEKHQDWEPVIARGKPPDKKAPPPPSAKIESIPKFNAGTNKQRESTDAARLERKLDDEDYQTPTVSMDLKKKIQQARREKKWTQKQLAQQCNLDVSIVINLEAGKGIPNPQDIQKISRALGVPLSNKSKT